MSIAQHFPQLTHVPVACRELTNHMPLALIPKQEMMYFYCPPIGH